MAETTAGTPIQGTPGVTPSPAPPGPAPHTFVTGINTPAAHVATASEVTATADGSKLVPAQVGLTFASYTSTLGRTVPQNVNRALAAAARMGRTVR